MFSRILVPLDGSARAEQALPLAARIARTSDAQVVLVRAVAVAATFGVTYEGRPLRWHLVREEAEQAQKYLREVAQSTRVADLHVDSTVEIGPAAEVIVDAARERGADLVVMMSHGRTGLGRWVIGSVADHVAHHAPVPVLIVRDDVGSDSLEQAGERQRLHVLVPLDGSPLAETAFAPASALALALAQPRPGHVHLLLVVAPYRAVREYMPDTLLLDGAAAYLEQVARRMQSEAEDAALTVTWSILAQGDIAHAIAAAAEKGETSVAGERLPRCDVIAMATHGQSAVARWALGSVTERVLHGTKLPLLIVRPHEMAPTSTEERNAMSAVSDIPRT